MTLCGMQHAHNANNVATHTHTQTTSVGRAMNDFVDADNYARIVGDKCREMVISLARMQILKCTQTNVLTLLSTKV